LLTKERILEFDRKEIFPEDVIREMLGPEIGLQLLMIPEAYGGLGGGAGQLRHHPRNGQDLPGHHDRLLRDPAGGRSDHGRRHRAQKQKWLGKIAAGEALVATGSPNRMRAATSPP
jgi:alkylation response protein AidB-like acyl-CoA dehydrogenase